MKKKTSIFVTTLASIYIPEILIFLIISVIGYYQINDYVKKIEQAQLISIERQVQDNIQFKELSFAFIDATLNERLEILSKTLNSKYEENPNIVFGDPIKLREDIGMNSSEDLYFINDKGVIVNSSYKDDIGFDFYALGESFKTNLENIRSNSLFKVDKFEIELSSQKSKKYSYQGTKDKKYILELGAYSPQSDTIINQLRSNLSKTVKNNKDLVDLDFIYTQEGKKDFYGFRTNKSYSQDSAFLNLIIKNQRDTVIKLENENRKKFYSLIKNDSQLYIIMYVFDYSWVDAMIDNSMRDDSIVLIVVLITLFLIVFINTRRITKPLIALTEKAKLISHGKLDERVEIKGTNEVSVLSYHFNEMVGQLQLNQTQLTQSNEELAAQRDEIEKQKEIVEEQRDDIVDSITYARRIQEALLKNEQLDKKGLPEHFILFKPKDIVSGDFYWTLEKQNYLYLAAVDCTGHGVPGAFLTMLGTSFLNEINSTTEVLMPNQILDKLRDKIVKELSGQGTTKDGMDMSIARINLETKEVDWAGANNPLYIFRAATKEIEIIKPDNQPIGYYDRPTPFTNQNTKLEKGDNVYLFTDGIADQFGGPRGKKLGYKALREVLVEISAQNMSQQKESINTFFEKWKIHEEQLDDVCIIGVKI